MEKEKHESVILSEFDYDDEISKKVLGYISPESEKSNEEKNNYQFQRVLSLINKRYAD